MMAKELSKYDRMMLLNQIQVFLVECRSKPRLASLLLKETWGDVANDIDLVKKPLQGWLKMAHFHFLGSAFSIHRSICKAKG